MPDLARMTFFICLMIRNITDFKLPRSRYIFYCQHVGDCERFDTSKIVFILTFNMICVICEICGLKPQLWGKKGFENDNGYHITGKSQTSETIAAGKI
jgi:hypothetical protein